eukprot:10820_2
MMGAQVQRWGEKEALSGQRRSMGSLWRFWKKSRAIPPTEANGRPSQRRLGGPKLTSNDMHNTTSSSSTSEASPQRILYSTGLIAQAFSWCLTSIQ